MNLRVIALLSIAALLSGFSPVLAGVIVQQAYLKASNTDADDRFGTAVAVSGDTLVVGAPAEDSAARGVDGVQGDNSATASGAAYVFVRDASGNWTQQAYLKASNTGDGCRFGGAVAISGDTIVVGAKFEDSDATGVNGDQNNVDASASGAAYVFVRDPASGSWSQQAYLKASNTGPDDNFGASVAVSGSHVVVGAPFEDSSSGTVNGDESNNDRSDSGAAYVFRRTGTVWEQTAYIKAPNPGVSDEFGTSVAISGTTVAIGSPSEDGGSTAIGGAYNDDVTDAGAVYVYTRENFTPLVWIWVFQEYIKASDAEALSYFGRALSISGDTLVASALVPTTIQGIAYIFERSGVAWSQDYRETRGPDTYNFGASLAVTDGRVVIGASQTRVNLKGNAGSARVYDRRGDTWTTQFPLVASNYDAGDVFGSTVAIDGRWIVVGAFGEASAASGVDGDQGDESAALAGAAYVFYEEPADIRLTGIVRSGTLATLNFTSEAGIPDGEWRVKGSGDLAEFAVDHTGMSIIAEISPGVYQALVNLAGAGDHYFLRVERLVE